MVGGVSGNENSPQCMGAAGGGGGFVLEKKQWHTGTSEMVE